MEVKNVADLVSDKMMFLFIMGIPILFVAVLFLADGFSNYIWSKRVHH